MQRQEIPNSYTRSAEKPRNTWLVNLFSPVGLTQTAGCEGDFLEIRDGAIFEAKGLIHTPDWVIAYPRYMLDKRGDRLKNGRKYRKFYRLNERYTILRRRYPQFIIHDSFFNMEIPRIPTSEIEVHHRPAAALQRLLSATRVDETEQSATELAQLIQDRSGVSLPRLGVSGSVMVGLHTQSSDIDIIVYGTVESRRVREAMLSLLKDGEPARLHNNEELQSLYNFRVADTPMSYDQFVRQEARKTFQGFYLNREFFIRYLPRLSETGERYGGIHYYPEGSVRVKAVVEDASESFYTPCRYRLSHTKVLSGRRVPDITEAASFRGRFCEQAEAGETVLIQGKMERVVTTKDSHRRILIGGASSDFMISLSLQNS
jgi:predicted nucleotidyltransferase